MKPSLRYVNERAQNLSNMFFLSEIVGNNQSMQVGAESLSGLFGGALAASAIMLPLLVFAGAAIFGGLALTRVRPRELPLREASATAPPP